MLDIPRAPIETPLLDDLPRKTASLHGCVLPSEMNPLEIEDDF